MTITERAAHRTAADIGRTDAGPRALPPLGTTRGMVVPDVVRDTLAGGLRVVVARRAGVPMTSLQLRIPFAGDPPTHTARAEVLAASMLTGTGRRRRVSLDEELAGVGANLSVGVDPEQLTINGSSLSSGISTTLDVLADILTGAVYPADEVVRERERLVERITVARSRPATIAREALQRKRFGDHPITLELPDAAVVADAAPEQVRALHQRAVVPRGSTLVVVGDLPADQVVAELAQALNGWAADHAARELDPPPAVTAGDLELVHRHGAVQSQLRLSAQGVRRDNERYGAFQLANLVLGGFFSSRLVENVRESKGYTYHASSGLEFIPGGAVLGVELDTAADVTPAALLETRYELRRLGAVPPTADEVEAARRYAIGSLLISLDSLGGLLTMLSALDADGLDTTWLREHPARLEAVTPDEVAGVALEFFAPTRFTGVVVGDAEIIGDRLRALGGIS